MEVDKIQEFRKAMYDAPPYVTVFEKDGEVWKSFTEWNEGHYSQYIVSNKGNFARMTKSGRFKHIAPFVVKDTHIAVRLSGTPFGKLESERITYSVANAVATAFIPNPYKCQRIDFKDGNPLNCCVDNLEWHVPKYYKLMAERSK